MEEMIFKGHSMSSETTWFYREYMLLLMFIGNYDSILHRSQDTVTYLSKIAPFCIVNIP